MSGLGAEPGKDTDAIGTPYSSTSYSPSSKETDYVDLFQRKIPIAFVLILSCAVHWSFMSNFGMQITAQQERGAFLVLGVVLMTVFYVAEVMFLYSYFLCMFTAPGNIPRTAEWVWSDLALESNRVLVERKQTDGARRFCRWCALYKPDRAHHCRRCGKCILKMDHHCAWIDNCVGFKNHKFFFLSIFYASFDIFLFAVMRVFDTGMDVVPGTSDAWNLFTIVMNVLSAFFATSFLCFFLLHVFLMLRAETTLEFRERSWGVKGGKGLFDQGSGYANICAVLGPTPWLWFVPVFNTPGDGTSWADEDEESSSFPCGDGSPNSGMSPFRSPVWNQAGHRAPVFSSMAPAPYWPGNAA